MKKAINFDLDTKEILRMKFVFDKQKLLENNLSEEICLNIIRNYTIKRGIVEISKGVFDSSNLNNTEPFFYMIMKLPYTKWFLKVIQEWKFYFDNGIEDCLASYYKVNALANEVTRNFCHDRDYQR